MGLYDQPKPGAPRSISDEHQLSRKILKEKTKERDTLDIPMDKLCKGIIRTRVYAGKVFTYQRGTDCAGKLAFYSSKIPPVAHSISLAHQFKNSTSGAACVHISKPPWVMNQHSGTILNQFSHFCIHVVHKKTDMMETFAPFF